MSQHPTSKKSLAILGAIVLVLAGVAAYFYFGPSEGGASSTPVQQAEHHLHKIDQSLSDEVKKANAPPPEIERTAKKGPIQGK